MYFGSTRDVENCQPNAMKNVMKEKPHFSKCHEKCHKRKKKSHTSPGVEIVQL